MTVPLLRDRNIFTLNLNPVVKLAVVQIVNVLCGSDYFPFTNTELCMSGAQRYSLNLTRKCLRLEMHIAPLSGHLHLLLILVDS